MAGWGVADITPETEVPLAGYSGRHGKPSLGIHDRPHVKALVIGDGHSMAIRIGIYSLSAHQEISAMKSVLRGMNELRKKIMTYG